MVRLDRIYTRAGDGASQRHSRLGRPAPAPTSLIVSINGFVDTIIVSQRYPDCPTMN